MGDGGQKSIWNFVKLYEQKHEALIKFGTDIIPAISIFFHFETDISLYHLKALK